MKAFYILKPDAIGRDEVIKAYQTIMDKQEYIKNRKQFLINSWVDLSCRLYEPRDQQLTVDQIIELRSKMLTTIKGYDYLYKDREAIIDIFDIPDDINLLNCLENIKYQIRDKYVFNTPKNYIKFLDLHSDVLLQRLRDIKIRDLKVSHIRVNYDEDIEKEDYNLACLNCIHFPDPDVISVEGDLEIIESSKVLTKKIKL